MNVSFSYKINNLYFGKGWFVYLPLKKINGYAIKENGMAREENVTVFRDTEKQVKSNSKLKDAVDNSSANQKLILETDEISVPDKDRYKNTADYRIKEKDIGSCIRI